MAQPIIVRVPRPSWVCLGGDFHELCHGCIPNSITLSASIGEVQNPHPTKRWLDGAPSCPFTYQECLPGPPATTFRVSSTMWYADLARPPAKSGSRVGTQAQQVYSVGGPHRSNQLPCLTGVRLRKYNRALSFRNLTTSLHPLRCYVGLSAPGSLWGTDNPEIERVL